MEYAIEYDEDKRAACIERIINNHLQAYHEIIEHLKSHEYYYLMQEKENELRKNIT